MAGHLTLDGVIHDEKNGVPKGVYYADIQGN